MEYISAGYRVGTQRVFRAVPMNELAEINPYHAIRLSELPGFVYGPGSNKHSISVLYDLNEEFIKLVSRFEFIRQNGELWIMLDTEEEARIIRNRFGHDNQTAPTS
ncbi:hypothetical protein [Sphingomonas sp. CFBP 13706]|uniref:hypothetical protein n=1 Tax=Sphingomonas sp. CFBP 13706 TaxID=2775314 RepID=UPI00177C810C|nr:hypothetical protein [Sphingomonas sp. CFBP 13706]MBD8734915.1 hypothetical protein [Sphingomonas sp. CFBP 13706]